MPVPDEPPELKKSEPKHTEPGRSLGLGESPAVKLRYKGIMVEDMEPWDEFLKWESMPLKMVWYDVHVGEPMAVPDGSPDFMYTFANAVSRKRIDAVGRTADEIWVIEIKPYASFLALGQALTYTDLFVKDFGSSPPARPVIVATATDPDIVYTADRLGVRIIATQTIRT